MWQVNIYNNSDRRWTNIDKKKKKLSSSLLLKDKKYTNQEMVIFPESKPAADVVWHENPDLCYVLADFWYTQ